ncbi:MAG: sigma-70 family RNA polymerase sigma factor [Solirubrobacteraceae bacterium]
MAPQPHARAVMPSDGPACELSTLFRLCSAGDTRARETIIVRFLPLACRLARIYEGRGEPIDDLRQAASLGLIKAVDRFSFDRGDSFPAYARPVILGEIRRHFRDTTWRVHVPRPIKDRAAQVLHADRELGTAPATEPDRVADHLGLESAEIAEARLAIEAQWPRSLDEPTSGSDGDGLALGEVIGRKEPEYDRVEVSLGVRRALRKLGPRDTKVLFLRLAFGLTQDEIAGHVGVSQVHVSRILRNAGAVLTTSCGLAVAL